MSLLFVGCTLGNDPHTEGLFKVDRIARLAGIRSTILPPSDKYNNLLEFIKEFKPQFIGLSYRLSPITGVHELKKILYRLDDNGLLNTHKKQQIGFAGLPETIKIIKQIQNDLPCKIHLFPQLTCPLDRVKAVLDFFNVVGHNREKILSEMEKELFPPGISVLDDLAKEVLAGDQYLKEPLIQVPSVQAQKDLPTRITESENPVIRTHFGIPSDTIYPTVEGIKVIADARAVDEISLGSSDLSQRYFGKPEEITGRKNDGGVPYKTPDDLRQLFLATRRGNFPSIKPYAHVTNICDFIDTCLNVGMLTGAHQAIPLFWFNELDGRGPTQLGPSIREHIDAVRKLAQKGIPVEMNDPNQWASRWAHDTIIVTDYGLITAVMKHNGVKDMIFQFQFNKPSETGDFADLAKMTAALEMIKKVHLNAGGNANIWIETRTGIEHLSTDLSTAKYQLARSTLLQMFLHPHIIHLVSYCEADHAATPSDVIESSQIVRRAVRIFKDNEPDLTKYLNNPIITERRNYLLKESSFLLDNISELNINLKNIKPASKIFSDPSTLEKAVIEKYLTAPGITVPRYQNNTILTRPTQYGFFDNVDTHNIQRVIREKERIQKGR